MAGCFEALSINGQLLIELIELTEALVDVAKWRGQNGSDTKK